MDFDKDSFKKWMERSHPDFREHVRAIGKTIGYSELAMYTGDAGKKCVIAYTGEYSYGYGLVEDGRLIHGIFSDTMDTVSFS